MHDVVITTAIRTPVGRAHKGLLKDTRPDDLGAHVIREALARTPGVAPEHVDDVLLGNAHPEGEAGYNMARIAVQLAGLPDSVAGATINRFCASGLQTVVQGVHSIALGMNEVVLAGGSDCTSRVPMGGHQLAPNRALLRSKPGAYHAMGQTAEAVARRYGITREEQDAFAAESHRRAGVAIAEGRFREQIVPIAVRSRRGEAVFDTDEHCRPDTSAEVLARMRPVFKKDGTVTAGNASGINDGASFLVLASADAAARAGYAPMARIVSYAVAGVPNELMGEGPIPATRIALERAGLTLDQMDVIESNEAFAVQALTVIKGLGLDPARTNPNGGAVALGHPVAATGAMIATKAIHELRRIGGRYALATLCVGGGQGLSVIFERV